MTYTAIIHGATGIIDFAFDSQVTRDGDVIGIAPDPKPAYVRNLAATADHRASKNLWSAVTALNHELAALRPAILSSHGRPPLHRPHRRRLETRHQNPHPHPPQDPPRRRLRPPPGQPRRIPPALRIEFPAGSHYTFTPMFQPSPAAGHFRSDPHSFDFTATSYDVRIIRILPKAH